MDQAGSNINGEFLFYYGQYRRVYSSPSNPAACANIGSQIHPALVKVTPDGELTNELSLGYTDTPKAWEKSVTYRSTEKLTLEYNQQGMEKVTVFSRFYSWVRIKIDMKIPGHIHMLLLLWNLQKELANLLMLA